MAIGCGQSRSQHNIFLAEFVFRTRGNWLREYLRAYVVYGISAIAGIVSMTVLVDHVGVQFWLAQGMVMSLIIVFSFLAHRLYTFGPDRP